MFIPPLRTTAAKPTADADLASAQIRKEKQKVKSEEIIKACKGATKVSKDDWLEWLRRYDFSPVIGYLTHKFKMIG